MHWPFPYSTGAKGKLLEHRFRPKLLVLISTTHDKLVISRFDGCNFSCFADLPSLTVSRNKHPLRFHGVFSQFGKARPCLPGEILRQNENCGCFRCKFHRLFIRGYPVKTLFPVTRLNKRLICMRLGWIRWEWKTEKLVTIILLVHRVSNVRVAKERRGAFAGCYEYNENVSPRRFLSLSLSLCTR